MSQISVHAPAGLFSAPRARGMTLIVAPVSGVTGSIVAMRLYLAVVSGIGMYVGFRPWQRLRPGMVVPLAALLFSSLWIAIVYGFEAMPNQYVAFGALAAAGYAVTWLAGPRPRPRHLTLLAIAVAFVALVRPTDSLFLAFSLAAVAAMDRRVVMGRRLSVWLALAVGLVAGWAEWIIEAYVRFGGPLHRLHLASAENTGGLHFALGAQFRALGGPILCRDGCVASAAVVDRLWWFALVALVALGLTAARRGGLTLLHATAAVTGLALAAQYIFFVNYAAPRFLLPAYALLSLPAAEGAAWLLGVARPDRRRVLAWGLAVVLLTHVAIQLDILERNIVPHVTRTENRMLATAAWLRRHGLNGACYVGGDFGAPIAYAAGCGSDPGPGGVTALAASGHKRIAVIHGGKPFTSGPFAGWPHRRIVHPAVPRQWRVYWPPGQSGF